MNSSETKLVTEIFSFREVLRPFGKFPGSREVSAISGSLQDDPGGITCMLFIS